MMSTDLIKHNFTEAIQVLNTFVRNEDNIAKIEQAANIMRDSLNTGKKIISCGNGGSMCDAMHFAEELSGRFRNNRRALPAIAISDASHITCVANDYGFESIFSRFIEAFGQADDVLFAISTSGDSTNVINAVKQAKLLKMKTIALTGKNGGLVGELCDMNLCVTHSGYADRIQEVHIKIIHTLIQLIEQKLEL
ncbi:MAG: D-sedoheptulose 7-phosphate isomerase [Bacteroidales bacterium]